MCGEAFVKYPLRDVEKISDVVATRRQVYLSYLGTESPIAKAG